MGIAILLIQDKMLTDMDALVEKGRMPVENIPAAMELLGEFLEWVEVQPADYIPGDVCSNDAAMEAFCKAAQAEFHAQRKAAH